MSDSPKVSEHLEVTLEAVAEDDLVELVVELASFQDAQEGASRAEKIAARKEAFDRAAEPVVEAIEGAGGEVVGRAWINQTLKARVPRSAVKAVAGFEKVTRLDTARALEPDRDPAG